MENSKQKRSPRITIHEQRDWRSKVDAVYVRMLQQYRRVVELSRSPLEADRHEAERLKRNPPQDVVQDVRRLGEQRRRSGGAILPVASTILGNHDPDVALADVNFMLHWLAWNKFGKPLEHLIEEDRQAIELSSRQLFRVQEDFQKWRYGKLNPEALKTKFDREHWTLVMMGLDFGLDKLSQEELADFSDENCPCGSKRHSPENLRKLRSRVLETFQVIAGPRA